LVERNGGTKNGGGCKKFWQGDLEFRDWDKRDLEAIGTKGLGTIKVVARPKNLLVAEPIRHWPLAAPLWRHGSRGLPGQEAVYCVCVRGSYEKLKI
jgi:hypothetical protein